MTVYTGKQNLSLISGFYCRSIRRSRTINLIGHEGYNYHCLENDIV